MSFVRIDGKLPGDNGRVRIDVLTEVKITLVGFLNGGDGEILIHHNSLGDQIALMRGLGGFEGTLQQWRDAAEAAASAGIPPRAIERQSAWAPPGDPPPANLEERS